MKLFDTDWKVLVARTGYSAKCVVYSTLGILIIYSSITLRGVSNISKKTVYQEILSTPLGYISLSAVVLGLLCYVVWRLMQGVINPDNLRMSSPKDAILRVFYFLSAIAYSFATYLAFKVLIGKPSANSDGASATTLGNSVLQETFGQIYVSVAGILVIIFALIQYKHAMKQDFMDKFVLNNMSNKEQQIAKIVGVMGFGARGTVYVLVGTFVIHAAIISDAAKAGGLTKALTTLVEQPFGPWLLVAIGTGLLCFGLFCGFEGRYRKTRMK